MTGEQVPERMLGALAELLSDGEVLLTLGAGGARYRGGGLQLDEPAVPVSVADTTAAGDTFLGYFLAGRLAQREPRECLRMAARVAGLCVTRPGAIASIPRWDEVVKTA